MLTIAIGPQGTAGVSDIQCQVSAIAALERKNKEFLRERERERETNFMNFSNYLLVNVNSNFSDQIDFKKKEKALENFVI